MTLFVTRDESITPTDFCLQPQQIVDFVYSHKPLVQEHVNASAQHLSMLRALTLADQPQIRAALRVMRDEAQKIYPEHSDRWEEVLGDKRIDSFNELQLRQRCASILNLSAEARAELGESANRLSAVETQMTTGALFYELSRANHEQHPDYPKYDLLFGGAPLTIVLEALMYEKLGEPQEPTYPAVNQAVATLCQQGFFDADPVADRKDVVGVAGEKPGGNSNG